MADERQKLSVASPEAPVTVRAEKISKDFGGLRALDQVSFEVRQGEVLGLLGPNGAGKTTAMRILTGFFPPTEGKVWIENRELFKEPEEAKRRIGYLPESVSLYPDMKVLEFLKFVANVKGVKRKEQRLHLEDKLTRCGLWEVRNRIVGELSRGFKQRVGLAQALVGDPAILVLDEPTGGLDPKQIIEIRGLIRELVKDRTLVLCTHILPEVSMVCDRVLILNQGRVVASGTTDQLEAGVKERHEVFILMGHRHRKDEALVLIQELPGVIRVTGIEEKNDQVAISIEVSKARDLRPDISRLFVQHQIPLLEIRSGKLSLEDIFLKIVVDEKNEKET